MVRKWVCVLGLMPSRFGEGGGCVGFGENVLVFCQIGEVL